MKNLRALIFPFAGFAFSTIAHAAPVQYQLTAFHTSESSLSTSNYQWNAVNSSDYFFGDGTPITVTFYYDSAVAPTSTNVPLTFNGSNGTYTALSSSYLAFSDITFEVAGHYIEVPDQLPPPSFPPAAIPTTSVIDSDNTSDISQDHIRALFIKGNFGDLSFGDFQANFASIMIGGNNDMFSDQSLPNSLTGLNPLSTDVVITFLSGSDRRSVTFSNGTISEVPLPSAAWFFLSGLIGLGANAVRKLKR